MVSLQSAIFALTMPNFCVKANVAGKNRAARSLKEGGCLVLHCLSEYIPQHLACSICSFLCSFIREFIGKDYDMWGQKEQLQQRERRLCKKEGKE